MTVTARFPGRSYISFSEPRMDIMIRKASMISGTEQSTNCSSRVVSLMLDFKSPYRARLAFRVRGRPVVHPSVCV